MKKGNTVRVFFDAERMKYKHVGLYYYCLHLGNSLLKIAQKDSSLDLSIYSVSNVQEFDYNPKYITCKKIHKLFLYPKPKPDIWHANYQVTSYLPNSSSIKKVITIHDLNFLREKPKHKHVKHLRKLQSNISKSDYIVCISEFVAKELKEHINLGNKPCKVIYNGNNINLDLIPQKPNRPNIDFTKPYFFFVGAVLPKKNIQILPYLLKENDFQLIIAGGLFDEEYQNEIEKIAESVGAKDRLHFLGFISEEEKHYLLQHCRYFCFPSLTEGFGLPIVEAMHFGKDLLLSKATSVPEIGGEDAFYFESYDPDYLISLGKELSLKTQEVHIKNRLIERSKLFNWDNAAKEYWEIYKELGAKS